MISRSLVPPSSPNSSSRSKLARSSPCPVPIAQPRVHAVRTPQPPRPLIFSIPGFIAQQQPLNSCRLVFHGGQFVDWSLVRLVPVGEAHPSTQGHKGPHLSRHVCLGQRDALSWAGARRVDSLALLSSGDNSPVLGTPSRADHCSPPCQYAHEAHEPALPFPLPPDY